MARTTDTRATLEDVEGVCNYVDALIYARAELARPRGLPLCVRPSRFLHGRLMKGVRGSECDPARFRVGLRLESTLDRN